MAAPVLRYARALFEAATGQGVADAVGEDLQKLQALLDADGVVPALVNPDTAARVRSAVVERLADGRHPLVGNAMRVALERGRSGLLPELHGAFRALQLEARGEVEGTVESAHPLDDAAVQQLQEKAAKLLGSKVQLTAVLNEELIGGVRLRVGNTLWDGSVASALAELEQHLMQTPV